MSQRTWAGALMLVLVVGAPATAGQANKGANVPSPEMRYSPDYLRAITENDAAQS